LHYDIFASPQWWPLPSNKVTFFYNKKDDIDSLAIPLEPSASDIVRTRPEEEAMWQGSFLRLSSGSTSAADVSSPA